MSKNWEQNMVCDFYEGLSYEEIGKKYQMNVLEVKNYMDEFCSFDASTTKEIYKAYREKGKPLKNDLYPYERIYLAYNYLLAGKTLKEIGEILQTSESTISRDLKKKLPLFCPAAGKVVSEVLKLNSQHNSPYITEKPSYDHRNIILNHVETEVMASASAFLAGIKLDKIMLYYQCQRQDVIYGWAEILSALDWSMYVKVAEKLNKEYGLTFPNEDQVILSKTR